LNEQDHQGKEEQDSRHADKHQFNTFNNHCIQSSLLVIVGLKNFSGLTFNG
jgi:hypothetical protein